MLSRPPHRSLSHTVGTLPLQCYPSRSTPVTQLRFPCLSTLPTISLKSLRGTSLPGHGRDKIAHSWRVSWAIIRQLTLGTAVRRPLRGSSTTYSTALKRAAVTPPPNTTHPTVLLQPHRGAPSQSKQTLYNLEDDNMQFQDVWQGTQSIVEGEWCVANS